MSSRRVVASCAAMALVVATGSWYTVSALPLRRAAQVSTQKGPGPLERSARGVTPENPIPRRVHAEDPNVPNIPGLVGGTVVVKVTIDELGRIAEARAVEMAIRGTDFTLALLEPDLTAPLERSLSKLAAETASVVRQAAPALMDSALASVRQWRYDSPAQGPLAFDVAVRVGAAPEIMVFAGAGNAPAGGPIKTSDNALRVGGAIKTPTKVRDVRPVYPPIALAANVTGVVVMEARIGTDGGVEDARVLRSIPLLDGAALDAVKQWKFAPTLLNGVAVPIIMTLTVNFTTQ